MKLRVLRFVQYLMWGQSALSLANLFDDIITWRGIIGRCVGSWGDIIESVVTIIAKLISVDIGEPIVLWFSIGVVVAGSSYSTLRRAEANLSQVTKSGWLNYLYAAILGLIWPITMLFTLLVIVRRKNVSRSDEGTLVRLMLQFWIPFVLVSAFVLINLVQPTGPRSDNVNEDEQFETQQFEI